MDKKAGERKRGVQSLDRALAILRTFSPEQPTIGVTEIARLTGLSPSTTHRLLASLEEHGLVMKAAGSTQYMLASELLRLADIASRAIRIADVATPIMTELRDASDETVGLHVLDKSLHRRVIHQVQSTQPVRRIYTEVGLPLPVHQGAPGKVFLAFMEASVRDRILVRRLAKATTSTPVDPAALRAQCQFVQRHGYAISLEERVPGTSTVAAPVRNHAAEVFAAVSISGPSTRMAVERLHGLAPVLRDGCERLSNLLGWRPPAGMAPPKRVDALPWSDTGPGRQSTAPTPRISE